MSHDDKDLAPQNASGQDAAGQTEGPTSQEAADSAPGHAAAEAPCDAMSEAPCGHVSEGPGHAAQQAPGSPAAATPGVYDAPREPIAQDDAAAAPPASAGGQPPAPPHDDDPSLDEDDEDEDDDEDDDDREQMTFMEHLTELRVRLTRVAIAAGVGFLACYGFSKQLFEYLMQPLVEVFPPDSKLIFTALPEAFFTYIKVAMVGGIILTSPYIFYQVWCFIAPGLYDEERKYLIPIAFVSGLFFAAGATFGYSVVFPFAFEFFMDFATETIRPMPSLKEYLSFSLKLLFAFGLTFELPLFIFFLARLGIVNSTMLRKFRKYAFLCCFIVSAVLTPPDIVSQTLMAGPLIILYELSIWVAHVFGKKRKKPDEDEEEDDESETEEDAVADKPAT